MRILELYSQNELKQLMRDIKVDPYGIKIMLPKAQTYLIRINSLSSIAANILKQELLSLGGDAAISRDALTGRVKKTDCLLMANLTQFKRLNEKLTSQPFGLALLAKDISNTLDNYQREEFTLNLGKYKFSLLDKRAIIMAIVNMTPDSFSGDGLLSKQNVVSHVQKLIEDGADIIDIGGESSRPGASAVSLKVELSRVIPLIKALVKRIKVPISVDTHKSEVALQALDAGAAMINDITGLRDNKMAKVIARYKAGVVLMHMQGRPLTMQKNPHYQSLIDEIIAYLVKSKEIAISNGIASSKIVVDPGIGFGKTVEHNLEILKRLKEFKVLGCPIMVGVSRKSFIGKILGKPVQERICGTLAASSIAVENGANILRVHDVLEVKESLKIIEKVSLG